MKSLIHSIIYSCEKATLLIEKMQVQELSFQERIRLRFHLQSCAACSEYKIQSHLISNAIESNWDRFIIVCFLILKKYLKLFNFHLNFSKQIYEKTKYFSLSYRNNRSYRFLKNIPMINLKKRLTWCY